MSIVIVQPPPNVEVLTELGGPQGPQGIQGAQGATGAGVQGPQGVVGPQGPLGPQGSYGPQGTQGPQGFQGFQGFQGVQGAQGYTGGTGPQGAIGAQGATGATGSQGFQGFQGATGAQGYQGNQGAQGTQGSVGAQGTQGPQGIQGAQGLTGGTGNQGFQGAQGAIGAQGYQGPQGYTGTQGPQGPQSSLAEIYNATYSNVGFTNYPFSYLLGLPVIDVAAEYGADYTTSEDATTFIQNAIDAAFTSAVSVICYFRPGDYQIGQFSSGVTVGANYQAGINVVLMGPSPVGKLSGTPNLTASVTFTAYSTFAGTVLKLNNTTGVLVKNILIQGNASTPACTGISSLSGVFNDFEDIGVQNCLTAVLVDNNPSATGPNGSKTESNNEYWRNLQINVNTSASVTCEGIHVGGGMTTDDVHHTRFSNTQITFQGGTTLNAAYGIHLQCADDCHWDVLHFYEGGTNMVDIVFDYSVAPQWPAGCTFDTVDPGISANGGTFVSAIDGSSYAPAGGGVYIYNSITNILPNNSGGVLPVSQIPNLIAGFNEPNYNNLLQPGQTSVYGPTTYPFTPTSNVNFSNNNPFAVIAYVTWTPGVSGSPNLPISIQNQPVATLCTDVQSSADQIITANGQFRLGPGRHMSMGPFGAFGAQSPTVIFAYAGGSN